MSSRDDKDALVAVVVLLGVVVFLTVAFFVADYYPDELCRTWNALC